MTVTRFQECGLHKLSPAELAPLEAWMEQEVAARSGTSGMASAVTAASAPTAPAPNETVSFKYLRAQVPLPLVPLGRGVHAELRGHAPAEAVRRGGQACRTCGGSCR